MVAYSFAPRFIQPIENISKQQTLRNDRKRHARPGEIIQLYTGMRTRHCRLIGTAKCISAVPVRLYFSNPGVVWVDGHEWLGGEALDEFAVTDGFASWTDLVAFWREHHPKVTDAWEGIRIFWWSSFRKAE